MFPDLYPTVSASLPSAGDVPTSSLTAQVIPILDAWDSESLFGDRGIDCVVDSEDYDDSIYAGTVSTTHSCSYGDNLGFILAATHADGYRLIADFNGHDTPADRTAWETFLATVEPASNGSPFDGGATSGAPTTAPPTSAAPLPVAAITADTPLGEFFPYPAFTEVPQLGTEPVRGSGCGGNGEIGETIPDGLWLGYLYQSFDTIDVDLVCAYSDRTAAQLTDDGAAVIWDRPGFVLVNNNLRTRSMLQSPSVIFRSLDDEVAPCTPSAPPADDPLAGPLSWVRIDGGVVTWALLDCAVSPGG